MFDDIRAAFSFLTILPFRFPTGRKAGWSLGWYPLVGLFIGALLVKAAELSPFNPDITAFFILLIWVLITGGLHLDGFGDSCDGLLAVASPPRRLEIMKDARVGSWAAVGLSLLLLGKWLAIRSVDFDLLLLPPMLGRWAMTVATCCFPYARPSGLGGFFRAGLGRRQLVIASTIVCLAVMQMNAAILWLLTFGFAMIFCRWAANRLGGGITGDVYGAVCELTEILCLLAMGFVYG